MTRPLSIFHGGPTLSGNVDNFDLAGARQGYCGGRLVWSTVAIVLFSPYVGNDIEVSGYIMPIDAAGIALNVADNLIDATGADAGAAMAAAATTYAVYLSNRTVAFGAATLRASTTMPTLVRGTLLLGTTGDAANWRFLGWVRTNATPQFVDSVTQRFVINYYNRLLLRMFTCPGYVNDTSQTTYNVAAATHAALNGGTGASLEYIANGEDAVNLFAHFQASLVGAGDFLGGIEVAAAIAGTDPAVVARLNSASNDADVSAALIETPAAGYRTATLTGAALATTTSLCADTVRAGAAADPPTTYLLGFIRG